MSITLHINGRDEEVRAASTDSLRDALRGAGYVLSLLHISEPTRPY